MMKRLVAGLFFSIVSLSAFAADVDIAGYPTRDHGRLLKSHLESLAAAHGPIREAEGRPLLYVSDDAEFVEMLLRETSPQDYVRTYWKKEIDLVCGQEGEPQVFVALDEGTGTPVDWTRQVMLAKDSKQPLPIFIGLDRFESLIVNRLADATGAHVQAVFNGSDIHSDGRLLAHLKRQGHGLAWIDQRHLNAPGYSVSLYLSGAGDGDVPSLESMDLESFPSRFAFVYVRKGSSPETVKLAESACHQGEHPFLPAENVRARLDTLTAFHKAAIRDTGSSQ